MATTTRSVSAVLVVAAIAATAFWFLKDSGEQPLDEAFQAELITRVTPLVEEQITETWSSGAGRMACAVRPVGVEPASAATITEVTTVYAWARCDTRTAEGSGTVTPVAVHLTPAGRVEAPTDAQWDAGEAGEMFPERLHDDLLEGRTAEMDAALETALRERIRELS
ncbi:hypothetical protein FB565_004253 [Actinoplanes lutulentus]|uniref:Uncharacterized protein n=1 Tax=Actinoplanes lutulentus TaxID=1287878 RepID=A0A327ZMJ0_9ACTN|nr:hypothetical protein [Actinoplanes lutulentus]MBB2944524.1 hypothetical protein [Actinoplanes lutulentus]RAK42244.1 hypothetical protein B0I29_10269 [Actinoplanes lutulentus]